MHKFNLEIELENKDCCNGCSCLSFDSYEVNFCGHGYDLPQEGNWSEKLHETIQPRPDICKQNDTPSKV